MKHNQYTKMLVGRSILIQEGTTSSQVQVLAETKSTFRVQQGDKMRTLLKRRVSIVVDAKHINGVYLSKRPYERARGA